MSEETAQIHDPEDFDDEYWDDIAYQTPEHIKLTFRDWIDAMTPIWQAQIERLKKEGYLDQG